MGKLVNSFITDFQDMFVVKTNTIKDFPNNLSSIELMLIEEQIGMITEKLKALSDLSLKASKESLEEYKLMIKTLEDKLDYIENLSDILLYVNSFYDMNNVLTLKNYDLKNLAKDNVIYNNNIKGLCLRNISNSFDCPKELNDGTSFTYFNTNLNYHSGIVIESPFLDVLSVKGILVLKTDGTTIRLPVSDFNKNSYYIEHDFLSSTQIILEFNNNVFALNPEEQEYYKTLRVSLVDYEYVPSGSIVLPKEKYEIKKLLNFINTVSLPSDCFINMSLTLDLLDINNNTMSTLNLTLPLGRQEVCKRLDFIDFNEVKEVLGIYLNNKFKNNKKKDLTQEYLESLNDKSEIYIVYSTKHKEIDTLNKHLTLLNNQGIVFHNKNIKNSEAYITLDFLTFNKNLSPTLKMLLGVSKE